MVRLAGVSVAVVLCAALTLRAGPASTAVALVAAPAQAQNYPTKPIHILSPYAPGGISDIASRR